MRHFAVLLASILIAGTAMAQAAPGAAAKAPVASGRPMVKEIGYGGRDARDAKDGAVRLVPLPANFGDPAPGSYPVIAESSQPIAIDPKGAPTNNPAGAGTYPATSSQRPAGAMPPLPPIAGSSTAGTEAKPKELRSDKKLTSDASKLRERRAAEQKARKEKASSSGGSGGGTPPMPGGMPVMPGMPQ